jgi:uncharacterized peroxidase-related enzyme
MTTRIKPVDVDNATGQTKEVLDSVKQKMGRVPNIFQLMANSPAAVNGYLGFSGALSTGVLTDKQRELIAITCAQVHICEYCLSAHHAIGKTIGMTDHELAEGLNERSDDKKTDSMLTLARLLLTRQGDISDGVLAEMREAGLTDAEITEVIANVALNVFTNYFNLFAKTEVDFPKIATAFPA